MKVRKTSRSNRQLQQRRKTPLSSPNSCQPGNRKILRIECRKRLRGSNLPPVYDCPLSRQNVSWPSIESRSPRRRTSLHSVECCRQPDQEFPLPAGNDSQKKKKQRPCLCSLDTCQERSTFLASSTGKSFVSPFGDPQLNRKTAILHSCQPTKSVSTLRDDCLLKKTPTLDDHPQRKRKKSLNVYRLRRKFLKRQSEKSKTEDIGGSDKKCIQTHKCSEVSDRDSYVINALINASSPDVKKEKKKPSERKARRRSLWKVNATNTMNKRKKQKVKAQDETLLYENKGTYKRQRTKKKVDGEIMSPLYSFCYGNHGDNIDSHLEVEDDILEKFGRESKMSSTSYGNHDDSIDSHFEVEGNILEKFGREPKMSSTSYGNHDGNIDSHFEVEDDILEKFRREPKMSLATYGNQGNNIDNHLEIEGVVFEKFERQPKMSSTSYGNHDDNINDNLDVEDDILERIKKPQKLRHKKGATINETKKQKRHKALNRGLVSKIGRIKHKNTKTLNGMSPVYVSNNDEDIKGQCGVVSDMSSTLNSHYNKYTEQAAVRYHSGTYGSFTHNQQYREDGKVESSAFISAVSPDLKKKKIKPFKKKSQKLSRRTTTPFDAKKNYMKKIQLLQALDEALEPNYEGNINIKHQNKKTLKDNCEELLEKPTGFPTYANLDENTDRQLEVVALMSSKNLPNHDEDKEHKFGVESEIFPASSYLVNHNKDTESNFQLMSSEPLSCHDSHDGEFALKQEMSPIHQTFLQTNLAVTEIRKKTGSGEKYEKAQFCDIDGRGLNGWEQSLRQHPKPVKKFQATFSPDPVKKKELVSISKENKKVDVDGAFKQRDQTPLQLNTAENKMDLFGIGVLVWGKIKGYPYWPAQVVSHLRCNRPPPSAGFRWVRWFGDGKYSLVKIYELSPLAPFQTHYQALNYKKFNLYQRAVFQVLQVCAARAKVEFPSKFLERPLNKEQSATEQQALNSALINWAMEGFQPSGVEGFAPSEEDQQSPTVIQPPPIPTTSGTPKIKSKDIGREERIEEVKAGRQKLEDMCIACGSLQVVCCHPFFIGGLCEDCRVEFLETAYLFDNDGYQSYCCVCCDGSEVLLCGNPGCYRSTCFECVKLLDNNKALQQAIQDDPWICYMCRPKLKTHLFCRREDWSEKLVQIFKNDQVESFEPFRRFMPPPLKDRRPIKVLGLFDGIGTGLLALKELGFKIDCYVASEVDEEAIKVATVRHAESIVQVGDVRNITKKQVQEWGPFDLVMGGSPCNDLSIVNPARKGLFEGTGRLFFEFHRILNFAKPIEGDNRPFFWFLENVCFMGHSDKMDISRFLECNPVIVDAKDLTPAHRARYFWGNIPGMDRPNMATDNHNLSLQECLEPHCNRTAQFKKIRTITTKANSIKQRKEKVLPVLMNGKEDGLWCTEMERLFGFPEHYTDVNNMGRIARQRLLGRAWSVPVIKYILAPLKDFYACKTQ